jgi:alkylhydroperoxidase family enzyme
MICAFRQEGSRMRPALETAQYEAWRRLGLPGTWWTGQERLWIAQETRTAADCAFCTTRAAALSPLAVPGQHSVAEPTLPDAAIEAIHRIRSDPGRLGEAWFLTLREAGLTEDAYVELVSIVAVTVAVDTFRRGSGLAPLSLPAAEPGVPSRHRPKGAKPGPGFVATLAPEDRTEAEPDLYQDSPGPRRRVGANIHRALSLVPDSMIHWWDVLEELYQSGPQMRDYGVEYRAISHAQIELLAARVAALNRCEY